MPEFDLVLSWTGGDALVRLAREHDWPIGIVDLFPVAHLLAPAASGYGREQAVAAAREFLAEHPYLPVRESQRTLAVHRRCA